MATLAVKRQSAFKYDSSDDINDYTGIPIKKFKTIDGCYSPRGIGGAKMNLNLDKMSIASNTPSKKSPALYRKYRNATRKLSNGSDSDVSADNPENSSLVTSQNIIDPPNKPKLKSLMKKRKAENVLQQVCQEYTKLKKRKFQDSSIDKNEIASTSQEIFQKGLRTAQFLSKDGVEPTIENATLTVSQCAVICKSLLQKQEDKFLIEYEQLFHQKLNEQYETYCRFSQDQLRSSSADYSHSYIS